MYSQSSQQDASTCATKAVTCLVQVLAIHMSKTKIIHFRQQRNRVCKQLSPVRATTFMLTHPNSEGR